MHQEHCEAAEKHAMAARAHRIAAAHNEKGNNPTGTWHSERALEYANHAFELAEAVAVHATAQRIEKL